MLLVGSNMVWDVERFVQNGTEEGNKYYFTCLHLFLFAV